MELLKVIAISKQITVKCFVKKLSTFYFNIDIFIFVAILVIVKDQKEVK